MSRKNGKTRIQIHFDRLVPSRPDDLALAVAVEQRFLDLCGAWVRVRGSRLVPPKSMESDLLRWRRMLARHKQRDFRHSEAELMSVKVVAQWTCDKNAELRGQAPTIIEWEH